MTEEQLKEIEGRADIARDDIILDESLFDVRLFIQKDIPALLSEIRRLQRLVAWYIEKTERLK